MTKEQSTDDLKEELEKKSGSSAIVGGSDSALLERLATLGKIILRLDSTSSYLAKVNIAVNIALTFVILVAAVLGIVVALYKH
jgi:hypothetical protein